MADNAEKWNLEDNDDLIAMLAVKDLPEIVYTEFGLEGDYTARVKLLMPPDYSGQLKYPLLVDVYAGPESQEVSYRWSTPGWAEYLATSHNVIYAKIDGRGSGFQSTELMFEIYQKLGTFEIDDQIRAAKALQDGYPFVDAERTGIL